MSHPITLFYCLKAQMTIVAIKWTICALRCRAVASGDLPRKPVRSPDTPPDAHRAGKEAGDSRVLGTGEGRILNWDGAGKGAFLTLKRRGGDKMCRIGEGEERLVSNTHLSRHKRP